MCINPMSSWIKPLYDTAYHTLTEILPQRERTRDDSVIFQRSYTMTSSFYS